MNRNAIVIMTSGAFADVPASYACNLNGNGVYGEPDDGADLACNYLSIADLAAYLDWSALRPMTELEYEKACRGPVTPLPTEFPWGTTARATSQYQLANGGTNTEGIAVNYATSAGNVISVFTASNIGGPSRVGIFAAHPNNSGRETSGASLYGIMEMAGNVTERPISIGSPQGRAYTGAHGNGTLSAAGEADPTNWASAIAVTGFRGGSWLSNSAVRYMVSDRSEISWARTARYLDSGGRGVRNSP
ncbi:MAG: hypothetical protein H6590_05545 [Flavobacteriales bacterium]|nr:hypothetical protein [Flavobacteriales bacterium]